MMLLTFLIEWAIRSALLVAVATVSLKVFRVQNPSVRLAAWMLALLGSFAIPALSPVLPGVSVPGLKLPVTRAYRPSESVGAAPGALPVRNLSTASSVVTAPVADVKSSILVSLVIALYLVGAGALLLRLVVGLTISHRLIGRSIPTGRRSTTGTPIHESSEMIAPATLGIRSPVVILPTDWREWEPSKLETILAHEESHIRRHDPAVQLLSAVHRSLLWYSPASWFLHSQLVRVAEEASDDAALAATSDRVTYAEVLLQFMQRASRPVRWEGVAMARYGNADDRIHRILDGTGISRGLTRFGWIATVAIAAPVVYLAAAVHPVPQSAAMGRAASTRIPSAIGAFLPYEAAPARPASASSPASAATATSAAPSSPAQTDSRAPQQRVNQNRYLIVSGTSSTGWFDSRDRLPLDTWRSRFGPNFVWFRQDGVEYIITDQGVLDDLNAAMAPQREVNQLQAEVNRQQADVNRHQASVNEDQGRVNAQQSEVNRMQSDVNAREREGRPDRTEQTRVNNAQAEVNRQQEIVNREQDGVNQEQNVVNGEQAKVNAEQRRISAPVEAAVQGILDASVLKGLAHGISR